MPSEDDGVIVADRHVVAPALGTRLQNAFTFTRPGTTVTLR